MSGKKRFFGRGVTPVTAAASEAVAAGDEAIGALDYRELPVRGISIDDDQARVLGICLDRGDQYLKPIDDSDATHEKFQALLELAESVKTQGLIQPIKVYPVDPDRSDRYRVAAGNRRFVAHLLAGKSTINAHVALARPANLRQVQFIENDARSDYTPWERVRAVRMLLEEAERNGAPISKGEALRDAIHTSRSVAFDLWTLATRNAPEVLEAMREGLLNNIKEAAAIARLSKSERDRTLKVLRGAARMGAATKRATTRKGEGGKSLRVSLGKASRPQVLRALVQRVYPDWSFEGKDLEDPKVAKALLEEMLDRFASDME
ncbi:MAG: ParB/RepB/Spo0J family partition protein [Gammaproteobacteria bacterium]